MMSTIAAYGFHNAALAVKKDAGTNEGYVATVYDQVEGQAIATVHIKQIGGITTDVQIQDANHQVLIDVPGSHNSRLEFQANLETTATGSVIVSFRDAVPFSVNGVALSSDHYAMFDTATSNFAPCSIF